MFLLLFLEPFSLLPPSLDARINWQSVSSDNPTYKDLCLWFDKLEQNLEELRFGKVTNGDFVISNK